MSSNDTIERIGFLPEGTPAFIADNPQLWPRNQRFILTCLFLDLFICVPCLSLLFRLRAAGLRTPGPEGLATSRTIFRAIVYLFAFDTLLSISKGLSMLWIVNRSRMTSENFYQSYSHICSINGFSLPFVYGGIVMLVAEIIPSIGRRPQGPNSRPPFSIVELGHVLGWHLAYGLTILRTALFATKQYNYFIQKSLDGAHIIEIETQLTVLAFWAGILLLLPYWRYTAKGGIWLWASMGLHVAAVTYRLSSVMDDRDRNGMAPHQISWMVHFFHGWLPTILVLQMYALILFRPQQPRQRPLRRPVRMQGQDLPSRRAAPQGSRTTKPS